MAQTESATEIDYTGMQRAIEAQLRHEGWEEIHAEMDEGQLVIEAAPPDDAMPDPPGEEAR